MTTIIRATGAHDLLAIVPTLAGFIPERSIVCVAFRGTRSAGVLRHDLPRRAAERQAVVSAIVGTLCRMPGVDAVVPIAYTDATFGATGRFPERALLSLLVRRIEQAGFVVRDALCHGVDAWGSLLDPATPANGHPVAMIDESGALSRVPGDARSLGGVADSGRLPTPDDATSRSIAEHLARFDDLERGEAALAELGAEADPVELVEALLEGEPGDQPERRIAWFLHLARRPGIRDAMMLQFGFGPVVGETALDDAFETAAVAERTGETVDQVVRRRHADDPGETVSDLLARLLLGQTTIKPDGDRVRRALDAVRWAAAHAPDGHRGPPLCVAAWLAWALGMGSAAGALLEQAISAEPGLPMAGLLASFIGSGALPEWAFSGPGSDVSDR
ncbi:hypothetical protein J2X63_000203 [Agromyces sp. 3263]|uniref:DUF4192 family protein n=1 Tax=Agromyces sp. 3263 TaxID=2817750 RepID=UPI00286139B9|nr:DUF4192 family protein [Agromyces sp. 3263]MDR6904517.1 hypothetical protein [Agromyces sp. 3263]